MHRAVPAGKAGYVMSLWARWERIEGYMLTLVILTAIVLMVAALLTWDVR